LEFGDQNESWTQISNDLNRKFLSNSKFSIKNCKQEYRILVEEYKNRWIVEQEKCSGQWKIPLVKFIFNEFKSIYLRELICQIKESRQKILDMCLQLEPTINLKTQRNDSFQIPSAIEIAPDVSFESQPIEQIEEKIQIETPKENVETIDETPTIETVPQVSTVIVEETKIPSPKPIENPTTIEQIKEEFPSIIVESISTTENSSSNEEILLPTDSTENSVNSINENKTESSKNNSNSKPKYHIYFCPNNSTNPSNGTTKGKSKRKNIEEKKDDEELDVATPTEIETSKTTAPMTRRSISTRSIPNPVVEQEEENSRKFSAMCSENPNSWQSQANSILQFLFSQKQGYLFKDEITDEIAPKYHQFIRRPIALNTIRKNLESNLYETKEHFKRDIFLMLYNAMKYNPRHHQVHRSAKNLFLQTLPLFNLSNEDIQGQITRRNSTHHNDLPAAKRKRVK